MARLRESKLADPSNSRRPQCGMETQNMALSFKVANLLPGLSRLPVQSVVPLTEATSASRRGKDAGVETLRGVAIVLMVMGHVIGDTGATGLRVEDHSAYRHVYFLLEYLRMPLFTVISGFVYAMLPVAFSSAGKFIARKVERLFFPLLTIGTIQYVLHAIIPGTNVSTSLNDIWKLYVYSHDQFWFLHSIFLVFLTMVVLDGFHLMDRLGPWAVCVLAAVLVCFFGPRTEVFSFTGYLNLLPYFLLGCGIYRFPDTIFRRDVLWTLMALLMIGFYLQEEMFVGHLHFDDGRINPVALLVGLSGTVVLFGLRRPVGWLARLGGYSYGIFLLHVFPVAGSRIVLMKLGLTHRDLLFAIGLSCGVVVPIVMEMFIRKNQHLTRFLLGERAKSTV